MASGPARKRARPVVIDLSSDEEEGEAAAAASLADEPSPSPSPSPPSKVRVRSSACAWRGGAATATARWRALSSGVNAKPPALVRLPPPEAANLPFLRAARPLWMPGKNQPLHPVGLSRQHCPDVTNQAGKPKT